MIGMIVRRRQVSDHRQIHTDFGGVAGTVSGRAPVSSKEALASTASMSAAESPFADALPGRPPAWWTTRIASSGSPVPLDSFGTRQFQ